MKNKSDKIIDLSNVLETTAVIECYRCGTIEKMHFFDDIFDVAEVLYESGWRLKKDLPYCKNCK